MKENTLDIILKMKFNKYLKNNTIKEYTKEDLKNRHPMIVNIPLHSKNKYFIIYFKKNKIIIKGKYYSISIPNRLITLENLYYAFNLLDPLDKFDVLFNKKLFLKNLKNDINLTNVEVYNDEVFVKNSTEDQLEYLKKYINILDKKGISLKLHII